MKKFSYAALTAAIYAVSTSLFAQSMPTVIDQCPKGYEPAYVEVDLFVSTNETCPLLEDRELRKLVEKFGTGSTFAYPAVPGTCVSGTGLSGSITLLQRGTIIEVEGYSESAQRLFVEAEAVGDSLFISGINEDGKPFASGAAMTVVSLQGVDSDLNLDLVLADRFTIDYSTYPFLDTEDFSVAGSKGDWAVAGRLSGSAQIFDVPPEPIRDAPFNVSGYLCLK
jgi:hypothetical protein